MGCHFLLQGIFLMQGSNPGLLHLLRWQADSLPIELPGKPQRGFHFIIHVKVICDPFLFLSPPQAPGLSTYPISLHLCHDLKGAFAWEMVSILPSCHSNKNTSLNWGSSRLVIMFGYSKNALSNTAGTGQKWLPKRTWNVAGPNWDEL